MLRPVSSFAPDLPAKGDLLTPIVIAMVGCSTSMGSSGSAPARTRENRSAPRDWKASGMGGYIRAVRPKWGRIGLIAGEPRTGIIHGHERVSNVEIRDAREDNDLPSRSLGDRSAPRRLEIEELTHLPAVRCMGAPWQGGVDGVMHARIRYPRRPLLTLTCFTFSPGPALIPMGVPFVRVPLLMRPMPRRPMNGSSPMLEI